MRWTGTGYSFDPLIFRSPEDGGASAPPPGADAGGTPSPDAPTPASSPPSSPQSPDGSTQVSGETADTGEVDVGFQSLENQGVFDAFASDDLDQIEIPAAGTSPKPGSEQTEQKPPAAVAQKDGDGKQSVPAAPPKPEAAAPPAPDQTSAPDLSSPEGVLRGLSDPQTATALSGWLAQNIYALSDAEKEALDKDAVGAIPGIMARVHLESTKNTLSLLNSLVPKLIQDVLGTTTARRERGQEALQEFFKAFPDLNAKEHGALVDQFAGVYRGLHPKATRAEAIKFVGASIRAHLGLPVPAANGKGHAAPPATRPFTPARPGARQISSLPIQDQNPFAGMGEDHEE